MKKRTRRKIYAPVNPIVFAMEGASFIPERRLNPLRLRELAGLEAFRTGKAGLQEWHDMVGLCNLCEIMAMDGVGPEALDACARAQHALMDAAQRFEGTGRMGLTGPGLQALREVYEYHDLQRTSVTLSQYERCMAKMLNKTRSGQTTYELT